VIVKRRQVDKYPVVPLGDCTICFAPMERFCSKNGNAVVRWSCGLHYTHKSCAIDMYRANRSSPTVKCPVCRASTYVSDLYWCPFPSPEETIRMVKMLPPCVRILKPHYGLRSYIPDEDAQECSVYVRAFYFAHDMDDMGNQLADAILSKPQLTTVFSVDMRLHPITKKTVLGSGNLHQFRDPLVLRRAMAAPPLADDAFNTAGATICINRLLWSNLEEMLYAVLHKFHNVFYNLSILTTGPGVVDKILSSVSRQPRKLLRSVVLHSVYCDDSTLDVVEQHVNLRHLEISMTNWTPSTLRRLTRLLDTLVKLERFVIRADYHSAHKLFYDQDATLAFFQRLMARTPKLKKALIYILECHIPRGVSDQCKALGYELCSRVAPPH